MARIVDGWDFVKEGAVLEYKEDSYIAIVRVLSDLSTNTQYKFILRVIAANSPELREFEVSSSKSFDKIYSGMPQFYKDAEYMPIPMGARWPYIFDEDTLKNSQFVWPEPEITEGGNGTNPR